MPDNLEALYRARYETVLKPLAKALELHISECFTDRKRIDRISARAKDVTSFLSKANKQIDGHLKYSEPLEQIQDQVGARIITFYHPDVEDIANTVRKYFTAIEEKDRVPESEWEFGYFGKHYVLTIPNDVIDDAWDATMVPQFFELQIKTLFQHAWSEAEHDVGYKPGQVPLTPDQNRLLAFSSAQAWGADRVFTQLFHEREQAGSKQISKG